MKQKKQKKKDSRNRSGKNSSKKKYPERNQSENRRKYIINITYNINNIFPSIRILFRFFESNVLQPPVSLRY